jgi:hypothetical protein
MLLVGLVGSTDRIDDRKFQGIPLTEPAQVTRSTNLPDHRRNRFVEGAKNTISCFFEICHHEARGRDMCDLESHVHVQDNVSFRSIDKLEGMVITARLKVVQPPLPQCSGPRMLAIKAMRLKPTTERDA